MFSGANSQHSHHECSVTVHGMKANGNGILVPFMRKTKQYKAALIAKRSTHTILMYIQHQKFIDIHSTTLKGYITGVMIPGESRSTANKIVLLAYNLESAVDGVSIRCMPRRATDNISLLAVELLSIISYTLVLGITKRTLDNVVLLAVEFISVLNEASTPGMSRRATDNVKLLAVELL